MTSSDFTKAVSSLLALGALAATLTGCAGFRTSTAVEAPIPVKGAAIHGSVFGGQQAVVGATIKLYATGTTGYGSPYTYTTGDNLLGNMVITTAGGGAFDITGDYTCPSATTPVYLVALGGNSGYTTNSNIALMAALGPCGNLTASTFVTINEVTTVASVYALAPFITGTTAAYAKIGTSSTNAIGLANAMADVNVLANVASGAPAASLTAPYTSTVVTGATMPVPAIDTLANILAACINSAGGTAGQANNCGNLFTATTVGGTAPIDTITAAFNIATHPAANISTLFSLQTATPPFLPDLTTQPNDFTLAAKFTTGVSNPSALAADALGNIWFTNSSGNNVVEFNHIGTVAQTVATATGAFNVPSAIAIGNDATLWITNQGNASVSRITTAGTAYTGSPYTGGGLAQPRSVSLDANGTAWIANTASVTSITNTGTVTGYTPAGATSPLAIAVTPH